MHRAHQMRAKKISFEEEHNCESQNKRVSGR